MRTETKRIIHAALKALELHRPMTLRQIFYRLVATQVIENTQNRYKSLSRMLVKARQEGMIPWNWIEDRLRRPRPVAMWSGLDAFADTALEWYRRDVWDEQPHFIEAWLEKDALSGIFERAIRPYGVTLNVGRGYDSWSAIYMASQRYGDGERATVLYFGDFDPSGEDMVRSLKERLGFFGCWPIIDKIALTLKDIERYDLPPDPTKVTDSRRDKFVARYGDVSVELDALPPDVLIERVTEAVEAEMDMEALEQTKADEILDLDKLDNFLRGAYE